MNVVLPFRKARAAEAMDWDALYREHVGRVFNFFRYRVGESATAEDLTATTSTSASMCATCSSPARPLVTG